MKREEYELLLNSDGVRFSAKINGKICEGVISVQEDCRVYLCQNSYKGIECKDKKGFDFSMVYVWPSRRLKGFDESDLVEDFHFISDSIPTPQNDIQAVMKKEDLLNCHGRKFEARIGGIYCEGIITVHNGNVYLCQDIKNGNHLVDTQGYKYAWIVTHIGNEDFNSTGINVTAFKLLDKPNKEDKIEAGCDLVSTIIDDIQAAVKLLKSNGYKILKQDWIEL